MHISRDSLVISSSHYLGRRLEHLIFPVPLVEPQTGVIGSGRGLMVSVTNNDGTPLWHSVLPLGCGVINSVKEGWNHYSYENSACPAIALICHVISCECPIPHVHQQGEAVAEPIPSIPLELVN